MCRDFKMKNGTPLWEELCYTYDKGLQQTRSFQKTWDAFEGLVDSNRFKEVQRRLKFKRVMPWWKDGCLLYFQQYSQMPIPHELERPVHDLDSLKDLSSIFQP